MIEEKSPSSLRRGFRSAFCDAAANPSSRCPVDPYGLAAVVNSIDGCESRLLIHKGFMKKTFVSDMHRKPPAVGERVETRIPGRLAHFRESASRATESARPVMMALRERCPTWREVRGRTYLDVIAPCT